MEALVQRISTTVRDPVFNRVDTECAREDRTRSEMTAILIEEALDARDKKAGRK
jgi:metal-responsive CopG/Arc/MetJ family transcriptional regulator